MIKSRFYQVVWVYSKQFPGREIPLVLLENGRPGYVINQWITYLIEEEITPSRLEIYIRALVHLYDFALAQKSLSNYIDFNLDERVLLADFIYAKKYGTDQYCCKKDDNSSWLQYLGLYWKPLTWRTKTLFQYRDAINQFDQWQVTFHNSTRLNPCEEHFLSSYEIYRDSVQRFNWDPLWHLHPTKKHTKYICETSVYGKYSHIRYEHAENRRKNPKLFPLDKFYELIQASENPRDKLLWLLMGAGSLRGSETLHLFQSDIEIDPESGNARVILADPEMGDVNWYDGNNKNQQTSRIEYFRCQWKNEQFSASHPLRNLQPRTQYGRRNSKLHAGFKGMTFSENLGSRKIITPENSSRQLDNHYIWWLDPRFGEVFKSIYSEYEQNYLWKKPHSSKTNSKGWPWHPWLFICTNPTHYGMPLTMPALKQSWKRALRRIGMENSGLGLHSLRHMYGFYCANILKLDLEIVQMLMHHANINSTRVYFGIEESTLRELIKNAAMLDNRISENWITLANG